MNREIELQKMITRDRLEQHWAAATDWAASQFERRTKALVRLSQIAVERDVTALRDLDDDTLAQVCNVMHLCLMELTKRVSERMEDQP